MVKLSEKGIFGFSFAPQKTRCVFEFDFGAILKTVPDDKDGEQVRADRRYKFMRSFSGQGVWKSVVTDVIRGIHSSTLLAGVIAMLRQLSTPGHAPLSALQRT